MRGANLSDGGWICTTGSTVYSWENAIRIIAKVIIDIAFRGLAFYLVGFGIAYVSSNGWFAFNMGITECDLDLRLNISNKLFWFIQLGFAIAAISIVSGAVAERMKIWAYDLFVVTFCAGIFAIYVDLSLLKSI